MKKLLYFGFFLLGLGILLSFFNSGGKIGYSTFENCSYKTYDNKVVVSYSLDGCRESVVDTEYKVVGKTLNIYYDLESHCGGCASMDYDDSFSVSRSSYDNVKVYYRYVEQEDGCEGMVYKPMIYIYPEYACFSITYSFFHYSCFHSILFYETGKKSSRGRTLSSRLFKTAGFNASGWFKF